MRRLCFIASVLIGWSITFGDSVGESHQDQATAASERVRRSEDALTSAEAASTKAFWQTAEGKAYVVDIANKQEAVDRAEQGGNAQMKLDTRSALGQAKLRSRAALKTYLARDESLKSVRLSAANDKFALAKAQFAVASDETEARDRDAVTKVQYNKFDDATTLWTTDRPLTNTKGSGHQAFSLSARGSGDQIPDNPNQFRLTIISTSSDWVFLDLQANLRMDVVADDERLSYKADAYTSKVVNGPTCIELFYFIIPTDDLRKIIRAKNVDCRIGINEYHITASDQGLLATLAARTGVRSLSPGAKSEKP